MLGPYRHHVYIYTYVCAHTQIAIIQNLKRIIHINYDACNITILTFKLDKNVSVFSDVYDFFMNF